MGLERNQPHGPAGTQKPPVRGEQAIAGSEETVAPTCLTPRRAMMCGHCVRC